MKARNREINIFSLSLMDVISGAMGAFLIVMVLQARFRTVEEGVDPEKLRPRLDAAMQALANIRAGTERTIADRFVAKVKPRTLGLSGGETVPEITALDNALRADIESIDAGFAHALEGRAEAVDALAGASANTEKIFKDYGFNSKPKTLGLNRGNSVPDIKNLGQALRSDIGEIEKGIDRTIKARNAAVKTLATASDGTEKVVKDRIGTKPATLGLKRGFSVPEIENLGGALRGDIETIYRELRKGKESAAGTPLVVTTVFSCGSYYLQIASDETNPSTGKPNPPYTPVPRDDRLYINPKLQGPQGQVSIWYPAITYLNPKAVPGRHYKIYLFGFSGDCKGTVLLLGPRATIASRGRSSKVEFSKTERVSLSWPKDSIDLGKGKRYGMYYFGTITVAKNRNISFARATQQEQDAELKAMKERMEGRHRPAQEKDTPRQNKKEQKNEKDKPAPNKKAVLAMIDKFPVPRDMRGCAQLHNVAARALKVMKIPAAQSSAVLNEILVDCSASRFEAAKTKLRAAMQRLAK
ncbi:MAG: hypothetical protein MPJ78_15790 [Hyphomicrobiaceae bacterium]|nr:hypothetical protein [Hyphomicrobiaceae bacterium]